MLHNRKCKPGVVSVITFDLNLSSSFLITFQKRFGHSCGSFASVSWPTSGPKLLPALLFLVMLPVLSWPSVSSQSSPG